MCVIYWLHQKRNDRSAKGQSRGILANAKWASEIIFPPENKKNKINLTNFEVTLCHLFNRSFSFWAF